MTSEGKFEVTGTVERCSRSIYHVRLDGTGTICLCYPGGKLRKHNIQILPGDRVLVELDTYSKGKRGRVLWRYK